MSSKTLVITMNNEKEKKTTTAQHRWRLLARALTRSPELPLLIDKKEKDEISVRRFTTFNLITSVKLNNGKIDNDSLWYEYSCLINENKLYTVDIRTIQKSFTANELIGFNNTGNICVWPSEECLSYYLLNNKHICKNKNVLELGGGMSCLAGVFVAKYCKPSCVTLTDGNLTSVENVKYIIDKNNMNDYVKCGIVQWTRAANALRQQQQITNGNFNQTWNMMMMSNNETECIKNIYDVILCADCLFFDDTRNDLVDTIYGLLADDGIALIIAPKRGLTFQLFADTAIKNGFLARKIELYDNNIWKRHIKLINNCHEYCPDLHYPILLELTKQKITSPG